MCRTHVRIARGQVTLRSYLLYWRHLNECIRNLIVRLEMLCDDYSSVEGRWTKALTVGMSSAVLSGW